MLFALSSALLLILSFPRFSFWPFAWIAFLPLAFHLERSKGWKNFFIYSYFFGVLFFLVTWEWLRHVSIFGWIYLVFAYAFYFGLFGLIVFWFWSRKKFFLSLFALPSAWVVLEWIRSEIPIWGFGWNLLAYSQAPNVAISGLASFVGAYGLSWLIVFVNVTILFLIQFLFRHEKKGFISLTGFIILGIILSFYFLHQLQNQTSSAKDSIRIGVIQGNIPQENKWRPENKEEIIKIYESLSRLIPPQEKPDLIVWPEAAFPGFFNIDSQHSRITKLARDLKTPLLLGSPHLDVIKMESGSETEIPYNSAYLIDHQNESIERYDKIKLVPFGEYVPWRPFFGPVGLERLAYSLGVSDFEPGTEIKIFNLRQKNKFSVLICFEDIFPELARKAVESGAQFLLGITNDAWFGKSAAPYQHLQASVFRAIENGVPIIRAANTGISGFVDSNGTVVDRVQDKLGNDIFISGGLFRSVSLELNKKTFYRKWGHYFPYGCLAFLILSFFLSLKVNTHD